LTGVTIETGRRERNMKTMRQLEVRFGHSECVKLTLAARPAPALEATVIRVVRIEGDRPRVRVRPI
jgi:hypothetical protein